MSVAKARRAGFMLLALFAAGGCATMKNQLAISTVNDCIKHNCKGSEAHAYQTCEASCHNTYGH